MSLELKNRVWEHKNVKKNNMLLLFQPTFLQGVPRLRFYNVAVKSRGNHPSQRWNHPGGPSTHGPGSCSQPSSVPQLIEPTRGPNAIACQQLGQVGWMRLVGSGWVGLGRLLLVFFLRPGRLDVPFLGKWDDVRWYLAKVRDQKVKSTKLTYPIQVYK